MSSAFGERQRCRIWTRQFGNHTLDEESHKSKVPSPAPLVLIHGMGAGIALFALNVVDLSSERPLFAIDLPGFARSSRPNFDTKDTATVERQFVKAIDEWRKAVGIRRMCLLGHSFGGYLSSAYAIAHPEK